MPLDWPEYIALASSLTLSLWIGARSKKSDEEESFDDFVTSKLPLNSIIFSLIAAETSGMSMLGKPAEAYTHGMEFFYILAISNVLCLTISLYVFSPILTALKTPTLYHYFELRFDSRVRQLTAITFIILKVLYTGTSIIPPALVISQFSGVEIDYIIIGLGFVTIFYTTLGGLKGVILTDVLQGIIMFLSMGLITVLSVCKVGGISRIVSLAIETGRTQIPQMTTDLSARSSVWVYFSFLYSFSPVVLNHSNYLRIKNLDDKKIKLTITLLILGTILMLLCATFTGLAIYAFYFGCDPVKNNEIPSHSNLVVYWLNDVGRKIFGLRGAYMAGITCASISSMSTHMNSSADVMYEEMRKKWNQLDRVICLRSLTVAVGILGCLFALYFKHSSSLIELTYCLAGTEGVISSLFIMGAIIVPVNAMGALSGGGVSLGFTLLVSLGSRIFMEGRKSQYSYKYMSTDSCSTNSSLIEFNVTAFKNGSSAINATSQPFFLFTISPFCVGILAVLVSLVVGLIVSLIFPEDAPALARNQNLYAPLVRGCIVRANSRIKIANNSEEMRALWNENGAVKEACKETEAVI